MLKGNDYVKGSNSVKGWEYMDVLGPEQGFNHVSTVSISREWLATRSLPTL